MAHKVFCHSCEGDYAIATVDGAWCPECDGHWGSAPKQNGTVVVTRHAALVDYLVETGLVTGDVPVISHATPDQVRGKHVVGVLPLSLAASAASVTEVTLDVPAEARGRELSLAEVRQFATGVRRYRVEPF